MIKKMEEIKSPVDKKMIDDAFHLITSKHILYDGREWANTGKYKGNVNNSSNLYWKDSAVDEFIIKLNKVLSGADFVKQYKISYDLDEHSKNYWIAKIVHGETIKFVSY